MKVTVHAEGKPHEVAQQLTEAALLIQLGGEKIAGKAPAQPAAATKAPKDAKPGKKAKPADEEEEEFELDETEETEEEEEAEESEDETEEEEEAEEEEETAHEIDDVIAAFQGYAKKHSREKAAKVLAKFKVKSVRDLKAKQYAEVMAILKK
jgi:hypothetical protein